MYVCIHDKKEKHSLLYIIGCCYVHKVVYKICRFSMYTKSVLVADWLSCT